MKLTRTLLSIIVAVALVAVLLVGCTPQPTTPSTAVTVAPATTAPAATTAGKLYIGIVSKGFQHQFWQTVFAGAKDAAAKYNVDITFEGPPSESDVQPQVDMLNNVIAKNPAAICLAALDTKSVDQQLKDCLAKKIPVIGFDSGVPNAPAGSILATCSTNNENAGALAADTLFKDANYLAKLKAATTDNPVVIGVESQDATSASITGRTTGFVNEMAKNCETLFAGQVAVTGHEKWAKAATSGKTAIEIKVIVAASTKVDDCKTAAETLLSTKNIISIFATNSGSVDGILAATSDGQDLNKTTGKYKDLFVVGFDAGKPLKTAVRSGAFYGAITQDPYNIGYLAVELAVKAIKGETVADKDTGCKFYNKDNMDAAGIANLLYD